MTFSVTNDITNGTLADADDVNTNFTDIENEFNGSTTTNLVMAPIGSVVAWLKSLTNTPQTLPAGWVECDGSTISDADSPYNGQVIPDLNGSSGSQRFLRGNTTSGGTGGTDTQTSNLRTNYGTGLDVGVSGYNVELDSGCTTDQVSRSSSAFSILPSYYEVVWIIRIK